MTAAKLIVMYPMPKDMAAFERAYAAEHIPMAAPIFQAAGATKAVLSKTIDAGAGTPAFHRIAEIHFPSMASLQACAASQAGREALAHAHSISNGGAPVVLVAEQEVVELNGA
ncbi:MAG: EthD family reductase [Pseudomonadota bacterium]|nr:EthD family reductase [Pseudomonadota bacterium]